MPHEQAGGIVQEAFRTVIASVFTDHEMEALTMLKYRQVIIALGVGEWWRRRSCHLLHISSFGPRGSPMKGIHKERIRHLAFAFCISFAGFSQQIKNIRKDGETRPSRWTECRAGKVA
jgi:hypothetical protein